MGAKQSKSASSSAEAKKSAAQRVFAIPELAEMIMLQRDPEDILIHYQNDTQLNDLVLGSKALQRKLYPTQIPAEESDLVPFHCDVNEMLAPKRKIRRFKLNEDEKEIYSIDDFGIGFPDELRLRPFGLTIKNSGADAVDVLPSPFLDTYLCGRAVDVTMTIRDFDRGKWSRDTIVLIPPGKTFGDVLHWVEVWQTGALKRDDVLNGIYEYHEADYYG